MNVYYNKKTRNFCSCTNYPDCCKITKFVFFVKTKVLTTISYEICSAAIHYLVVPLEHVLTSQSPSTRKILTTPLCIHINLFAHKTELASNVRKRNFFVSLLTLQGHSQTYQFTHKHTLFENSRPSKVTTHLGHELTTDVGK